MVDIDRATIGRVALDPTCKRWHAIARPAPQPLELELALELVLDLQARCHATAAAAGDALRQFFYGSSRTPAYGSTAPSPPGRPIHTGDESCPTCYGPSLGTPGVPLPEIVCYGPDARPIPVNRGSLRRGDRA